MQGDAGHRLTVEEICGRIVNPTLVDSQVIGAVTQRLGFALLEDRIVDRATGVVLNANLEEYQVPAVADVRLIHHARVDLPDLAANPTGAKGIGEPPLVPTALAIANAVYDATGVRFRDLPLSHHRVLPDDERRTETIARPDELVTAVPHPADAGWRPRRLPEGDGSEGVGVRPDERGGRLDRRWPLVGNPIDSLRGGGQGRFAATSRNVGR